jgi:ubiquinone/menaquinone biosynthesis C-methylase UbiE
MSPPAQAKAATAEDTAFVQFWNEVLAPKFVRFKHVLVGGLTRHSEAIFPSLPVRQGDRVLDVGCGFGDTAIKLADLVGPQGEVVGIDCCDAFLDYARKDIEARGLSNVKLVRGDAEVALPESQFDFVFSRFGTMFFANPVAGLRNMRKALRPVAGWCISCGAAGTIIPGCRWPRTSCWSSCRRRATTPRPAGPARSPCPTKRPCGR